jgi:phosphate transport system protein
MVETVRWAFSDDINEMNQKVIKMGSVVEQMLHMSITALAERNVALADEAIAMDDVVDDFNISIEEECLNMLALQQPMASDLRQIAATMKIITAIERMGDYIVDIAKTAKELSAKPLFKPLVDIPKMAGIVKKMLRDVLEAFVTKNLDLVREMIDDDDIVDKFDMSLYEEIIDIIKSDSNVVDQAVRVMMISKYLERLADHVTNVGKRIYYMKTGDIKSVSD